MSGKQQSESLEIVSLLLWANGGGRMHGFEEYRAWLVEAGFAQVRPLRERWLAASEDSEQGETCTIPSPKKGKERAVV